MRLTRQTLVVGPRVFWLALIVACSTASPNLQAQLPARGDRFYPADQTVPPGMLGDWTVRSRPDSRGGFQPVRVELPVAGKVTFFQAGGTPLPATPAPALAALRVGAVYRLRVTEMAEFPGLELYPSIELIDRLHPPPGREFAFPIPVPLTFAEIEAVQNGRLVTKFIYLEQTDRAILQRTGEGAPTELNVPDENAYALADYLGRPMAILRVGGRVPDITQPEPGFFGPGAPVLLPVAAAPVTPESAQSTTSSRPTRSARHSAPKATAAAR